MLKNFSKKVIKNFTKNFSPVNIPVFNKISPTKNFCEKNSKNGSQTEEKVEVQIDCI